jgi:CspA family cold shock protein
VSQGRISSLRTDKGFGFISEGQSGSSNSDIFFHRSAVVGADFSDLQEGQEVSFRTEPDPRDASRFRAANVQIVQSTGDNN